MKIWPSRSSNLSMRAKTSVWAFCLVLALGILVGSAALTEQVVAQQVGGRAPEIGLNDLAGRPVRLASLRGKVVLVDFWASWCQPCRAEFPVLNRLHETYASQGLVIVGVSVDRDMSNVRQFLSRTPASFRIVHDPARAVANRYNPPRMPSSYFIDKRGIIRFVQPGFQASHAQQMEDHVRQLLRAR